MIEEVLLKHFGWFETSRDHHLLYTFNSLSTSLWFLNLLTQKLILLTRYFAKPETNLTNQIKHLSN